MIFTKNAIIFLLLAVVLRVNSYEYNTPLLGTNNGYDVGGNDTMCWYTTFSSNSSGSADDPTFGLTPDPAASSATNLTSSKLNLKSSTITNITNETAPELDSELFTSQHDSTELLSQCFVGTSLHVDPLSLPKNRELFTGTDYVFKMEIKTDLEYLGTDTDTTSAYIRLVLCDAIRQGFCNPLRKSQFNTTTKNTTKSVMPIMSYSAGATVLGTDLGPMIVSQWVRLNLRRLSTNGTTYGSAVNITFRLPIGMRRGTYFFIGHGVIHYYLLDGQLKRLDVADAIPDNVVEVQDPPTILELSENMKIFLGCMIGSFSSIALVMFLIIIYHRNHIVMQLSQGPFLAAISLASVIQIVFSVSQFPTRDAFCAMKTIVTSVPQTFVAATLVARVWRAYSTLSGASQFARMHKSRKSRVIENILLNFLDYLANPIMILPQKASKTTSIRRTVSAHESVTLISFLTLPQIVVQIFATIHFDSSLTVDMDDNQMVGRTICTNDRNWAESFGFAYLSLIFILAVSVAWISRDLPSVFNEKQEIFNVAFIDAFLAACALALKSLLNEPTSKPDITVFVNVGISITIATCVQMIVVLPKIKRVLSGEKIVVGNVLGNKFSVAAVPHKYSPHSNGFGQSTVGEGSSGRSEESHILVRSGDPVPSKIEKQIHQLQLLLGDITTNLCDGKPLTKEEWLCLKDDVAKLQSSLLAVDLEESTVLTENITEHQNPS